MGAFHLRRLACNVAGKLGNAYLRYQNRQPATCFPLTATVAMQAIPVLPVKCMESTLSVLKIYRLPLSRR